MVSWTPSEARGHLADFDRSGLTLAEFCRRLGISTQRIYYWRQQLRRPGSAGGPPPPPFVEIDVESLSPASVAPSSLVIEFPSGHVLRITGDVDLAEVLRAAGVVAC